LFGVRKKKKGKRKGKRRKEKEERKEKRKKKKKKRKKEEEKEKRRRKRKKKKKKKKEEEKGKRRRKGKKKRKRGEGERKNKKEKKKYLPCPEVRVVCPATFASGVLFGVLFECSCLSDIVPSLGVKTAVPLAEGGSAADSISMVSLMIFTVLIFSTTGPYALGCS